jgi:hypothetical protein
MVETDEATIKEVLRLTLGPEDILVFRIPSKLSFDRWNELVEHLEYQLRKRFGEDWGDRFWVITDEIELAVVDRSSVKQS